MITVVKPVPSYSESYTESVESLSPRVLELRTKIHDDDYVNNAIGRIALVLSKRLVDNQKELKFNKYASQVEEAW